MGGRGWGEAGEGPRACVKNDKGVIKNQKYCFLFWGGGRCGGGVARAHHAKMASARLPRTPMVLPANMLPIVFPALPSRGYATKFCGRCVNCSAVGYEQSVIKPM